jgi:hypothetical protein
MIAVMLVVVGQVTTGPTPTNLTAIITLER